MGWIGRTIGEGLGTIAGGLIGGAVGQQEGGMKVGRDVGGWAGGFLPFARGGRVLPFKKGVIIQPKAPEAPVAMTYGGMVSQMAGPVKKRRGRGRR